MPNYRVDLAYDGSDFRGYAKQPGHRTVQGELERALAQIFGGLVVTSVAGRTDAGVHARGQVVSFQTDETDVGALQKSLNSMLGEEIVIFACCKVRADFDARFSARRRTYRYQANVSEIPDPMTRRFVWHLPNAVAVELMNQASRWFIGEIDFTSFCRSAEGKSNIRRVERAEWVAGEAGSLDFWISANAFCQQMVRALVGLCFDVGRGHIPVDDVPELLARKDRKHMGNTVAPPHGLTLWAVDYDVGDR